MARDFKRTQRLGEQIKRVLSDLISRELRDPRMGFVTVTDVEVTRDLSLARVYYSVLNPESDLEATREGLASASGFLRTSLGRALVVRNTPALRFIYDESNERAARIDALVASGLPDKSAGDADPQPAPASSPAEDEQ